MTDVDPERAVPRDPAEFVAAMRALKAASQMGFRTLEQRAEAAGDTLPKSTLVAVLSRGTLPREEVVSAFVRACGLDEDAVAHWVAVRQRLAFGGPAPDGPLPTEPPPAPEPPIAVAQPTAPESPAPWFADLVPPAISHGSWALRIMSAFLLGLVALVTVAAVVGSIRDWSSRPEAGTGGGSGASAPGSISASVGVPGKGRWTVARAGRLSLTDAQAVDFDTMRVDAHVPGADLELVQRGARLDATADIALLDGDGEPSVQRCLTAVDWDAALDGVDRLAPGRQACVVTASGLVVLLTLETVPTAATPTLVCSYIAWRKSV